MTAQLPTPPVRLTSITLIVVLAVLFVVSISVLILLKRFSTLSPGSADMEIFKAVLQLGVISVAAAAIAFLSFNYQFERQREQKDREQMREKLAQNRDTEQKKTLRQIELLRQQLEYREELLRNVLGRAVNAYSAVKKARRVLRALALRDTAERTIVRTDQYDGQMNVVNDSQLDFENLQRDVQNSAAAFSQPDEIVESLRAIDRYLGRLIKEYERKRPSFSDDSVIGKPLSDLAYLTDFVSSSKTTELFMKDVVHRFHDVQRLIRADLLNPKLIDFESLIRSEAEGTD